MTRDRDSLVMKKGLTGQEEMLEKRRWMNVMGEVKGTVILYWYCVYNVNEILA